MRRPPESVRTPPEIVRTPTEIMRSHLPDPSTARTDLAQFLADQVSTLETEAAHLWETYDLPARASAPTRAAFDTTPETILLERYLTASNRLRRQSLDELARLRRDAPPTPAPIEPQPPITAPPAPPQFEPSLQRDEPEPRAPQHLSSLTHHDFDSLVPSSYTPQTLPVTIARPT